MAIGEATNVGTLDGFRAEAIEIIDACGRMLSPAGTKATINAATTYVELVIEIGRVVVPLTRPDISEQLETLRLRVIGEAVRIEKEHLDSTSLVALLDRVVGVVTLSGSIRVQELRRRFSGINTYGQMRSLVRDLCQIMEADYKERAHAQLRQVLAILDNKIDHP